jgi:serine/threonine protein kinase, bacterial
MSTASPLVSNRYRVVRELGKGGFGATFLVEDTQLPSGKRCVLKELLPIVDNEETCALIQQRFEREAVILEELGNVSPQIPSLYAYFSENSKFYLVQEYVEGDTLGHRVVTQGVMGDAAVKEWLAGILPVLDCVHGKRIIHRDIKPDNIILRQRDHKPVLIDFGAVRETMGTQLNSNGKSTQSIVIGTPGFMPSEQAIGRAVFASDLYSLGLTAIYALTGRIPQELPTDPLTGEVQWRQFAPMVSAGLAGVIDGAIVPGIQGRFQTAGQMLDALLSSDAPVSMPGTVVSARPGAMPTQVSRVPVNSSMPTVVAAGNHSHTQPQYAQPQPMYGQQPIYVQQPVYATQQVPAQNSNTWLIALGVGSLVTLSGVGVMAVMKDKPEPVAKNTVEQTAPVISPPTSTSVTVNSSSTSPDRVELRSSSIESPIPIKKTTTISPSLSATESVEIMANGWIRIGAIDNKSGNSNSGDQLVATKQPVTISPPTVPQIGDQIRLTTSVNLRSGVPEYPNYLLKSERGELPSGQSLVIRQIRSFVDSTGSSPSKTIVWAEVAMQ